MRGLRRLLLLGAALVVVLGVLGLFFASFLLAAAVLLPAAALAWLATRVRVAVLLWRSGGRLPTDEGGVRVIGAGRARALALTEIARGTAGVAVGGAAPLLLWGHAAGAVVSAGLGLAGLAVAGSAQRSIAAHADPVDVLPPE